MINVTCPECSALVSDSAKHSEWHERAPLKEPYEVGYANGESSVLADWHGELSEVWPEAISATPTQVAEYIEQLQKSVLTYLDVQVLRDALAWSEGQVGASDEYFDFAPPQLVAFRELMERLS